jgi:beta-lactamase superfamily II metal-dependent hydrolase
MRSPIEGNVWKCRDLTFTFHPTFETITIEQNGQKVVMQGTDVADLAILIAEEEKHETNDSISFDIFYNTAPTTRSLPIAEW